MAAVSLLPARARGGEEGFATVAPNPDELDQILSACAAYCGRLSAAVLDFICEERIEEEIYAYGLDRSLDYSFASIRRKTERNAYIYDYQLIRRDGKVRENRTLLEENGRKTQEPQARLKTKRFFSYRSVFGPVGFFGRDRQLLFDYALAGQAKVKGFQTWVIEVKPKAGNRDLPSGRAWVNRDDGRIVKLEMDASSLEGYEKVMKMYDLDNVIPQFKTEHLYEVEKNGLFFPSRTAFRESVRTARGRRIQMSKTEIAFVHYRFFTVETQETLRKRP